MSGGHLGRHRQQGGIGRPDWWCVGGLLVMCEGLLVLCEELLVVCEGLLVVCEGFSLLTLLYRYWLGLRITPVFMAVPVLNFTSDHLHFETF